MLLLICRDFPISYLVNISPVGENYNNNKEIKRKMMKLKAAASQNISSKFTQILKTLIQQELCHVRTDSSVHNKDRSSISAHV